MKTRDMVVVTSCFLRAIIFRVITTQESHTARVFTRGLTEKCTMVSGSAGLSRATAFGRAWKASLTLDNGRITKLKVLAFIPGLTATSMRESGRATCGTAVARTSSPTEIATLGNMSSENPKVLDSIDGQTVPCTRDSSKTG